MIDIKWRSEYDKLWLKFKGKEFRFEDALEVIFGGKKFSSEQIKYGSKLINIIEDNGFAVHRKAEYDQRVRLYILLNPEKVSNARAIYKKVHEREKAFTFSTLLEEANKSAGWNYCYIKDTAIGYWTNFYRSVEVQHISISKEDVDGWITLFKLFGSSIILNDVSIDEQKERTETIHLHTDLDLRLNQTGKNHYQLPHYTFTDSLKDDDIVSASAIAIVQKNKIDWDKVIQLAKDNGIMNTLGFVLECVNKEAKKQVFSKKLLDKIEKNKTRDIKIIKGIPTVGEIRNLAYKELEDKWNVRCYQADSFKKVVLDLVR
ncbi:MAG: hypothetical protein HY929_00555 [Euryarchaeota archaeon]|nr:hypothetical protein [Euryarchaeota archaeon]